MLKKPNDFFIKLAEERLRDLECQNIPPRVRQKIVEAFNEAATTASVNLAERKITLPKIARAFLQLNTDKPLPCVQIERFEGGRRGDDEVIPLSELPLDLSPSAT